MEIYLQSFKKCNAIKGSHWKHFGYWPSKTITICGRLVKTAHSHMSMNCRIKNKATPTMCILIKVGLKLWVCAEGLSVVPFKIVEGRDVTYAKSTRVFSGHFLSISMYCAKLGEGGQKNHLQGGGSEKINYGGRGSWPPASRPPPQILNGTALWRSRFAVFQTSYWACF